MASSADKYTAYNATAPAEEGPGPVGYLALVLAWVVPGLGHLLIGQKARGIIFMVSIHGLFGLGLFIGGIRVINPPDQAIWTYTQFLTGWPMILANRVEKASLAELGDHTYPVDSPEYKGRLQLLFESQESPPPANDTPEHRLEREQTRTKDFIAAHPAFAVSPKIQDLGAVYCGIAGMLNLLVMFDVLLRITGSVREDPAKYKKKGPLGPNVLQGAASIGPKTQTAQESATVAPEREAQP